MAPTKTLRPPPPTYLMYGPLSLSDNNFLFIFSE